MSGELKETKKTEAEVIGELKGKMRKDIELLENLYKQEKGNFPLIRPPEDDVALVALYADIPSMKTRAEQVEQLAHQSEEDLNAVFSYIAMRETYTEAYKANLAEFLKSCNNLDQIPDLAALNQKIQNRLKPMQALLQQPAPEIKEEISVSKAVVDAESFPNTPPSSPIFSSSSSSFSLDPLSRALANSNSEYFSSLPSASKKQSQNLAAEQGNQSALYDSGDNFQDAFGPSDPKLGLLLSNEEDDLATKMAVELSLQSRLSENKGEGGLPNNDAVRAQADLLAMHKKNQNNNNTSQKSARITKPNLEVKVDDSSDEEKIPIESPKAGGPNVQNLPRPSPPPPPTFNPGGVFPAGVFLGGSSSVSSLAVSVGQQLGGVQAPVQVPIDPKYQAWMDTVDPPEVEQSESEGSENEGDDAITFSEPKR